MRRRQAARFFMRHSCVAVCRLAGSGLQKKEAPIKTLYRLTFALPSRQEETVENADGHTVKVAGKLDTLTQLETVAY